MATSDGVRRSPKGRRKWAELADLISEKTDDGAMLVDFAVDVMNGEVPGIDGRTRLEAAKFLMEYMVGKAPRTIEVTGLITHAQVPLAALGQLSDNDLAKIERMLAGTLAGGSLAGPDEDAIIVGPGDHEPSLQFSPRAPGHVDDGDTGGTVPT